MQPNIYFAMKSMPCFYFSNTFYTYNQRGCNQSIALGCETGWYSHCSLCEIAQSLPPPLRTTDRAGVGEYLGFHRPITVPRNFVMSKIAVKTKE